VHREDTGRKQAAMPQRRCACCACCACDWMGSFPDKLANGTRRPAPPPLTAAVAAPLAAVPQRVAASLFANTPAAAAAPGGSGSVTQSAQLRKWGNAQSAIMITARDDIACKLGGFRAKIAFETNKSQNGSEISWIWSTVSFFGFWRILRSAALIITGAFDSAKNHKRQRRKRQSVTAKREKSQTPEFV